MTQAVLDTLTPDELESLLHDWRFWARPEQLPPPGDWSGWLLLAGRGFGKTRVINEWGKNKAMTIPGSRGAFIGATAADVRDILIEGESGLMNIGHPDERPRWEPSKRRLTWPNGSVASTFSADEPDRLRGPQHHWLVADELASWRYPEAWDMAMMGLRLGDYPQWAAGTTPRPIKLLKDLLKDDTVTVTRGSTYDNRANLADAFFNQIIRKYEGTRLGRQELNAEILDDMPGALWHRALLDETRVNKAPDFYRVVVGVDPAASTGQTGIVVVGAAVVEDTPHGYVLLDATVPEGSSPATWAGAVVSAYHRQRADRIVGEVNNGGDMIEHVIRSVPDGRDVSYSTVRATRGKYVRAEPVAALFEQGRGHMVGYFGELEDELCGWVPGDDSPNRLDAMVWAFVELGLIDQGIQVLW